MLIAYKNDSSILQVFPSTLEITKETDLKIEPQSNLLDILPSMESDIHEQYTHAVVPNYDDQVKQKKKKKKREGGAKSKGKSVSALSSNC